jgi:hypothetical protein
MIQLEKDRFFAYRLLGHADLEEPLRFSIGAVTPVDPVRLGEPCLLFDPFFER